jgi:hypothetical protein
MSNINSSTSSYASALNLAATCEPLQNSLPLSRIRGGFGVVVTKETERLTDKGKAKEDDKFPLVA